MSLQSILFLIVATFTGLSAIAVLVSQNIVRSAVWLLFTLAGTAGIFFLLGADFVAATQLLIYVGGILVLVVFGVMLTAQGPFLSLKVGPAEWTIAMVVGLLLLTVLVVSTTITALRDPSRGGWFGLAAEPGPDPATAPSSTRLGEAFLGLTAATPEADLAGLPGNAAKIRRKPMAYLLPFEIVSVHLLVVLIGAAYLARAKRRRAPTQEGLA